MISISLPALAQRPSQPEQLPISPCQEVISACDQVIEKQDKLLNLQLKRLNELQSDNDKLSEAIVSLSREQDRSTSPLVWAGAGFAAGVITAILLGSAK